MDYEALYREIAAYEYEQAMYEATVFAAHMYPIVSDVPARVAEVVRLRHGGKLCVHSSRHNASHLRHCCADEPTRRGTQMIQRLVYNKKIAK